MGFPVIGDYDKFCDCESLQKRAVPTLHDHSRCQELQGRNTAK